MSLYAQHGYGKVDYIDEGLDRGFFNGVILSPKDEKQDNLAKYISKLKTRFGKSVTVLIDPQFYVGGFRPQKVGHLEDYDYFVKSLNRDSFPAEKIREYAKDVVDFQLTSGTDRVMSPAIIMSNFEDYVSQTTIQLGQASAERIAERKAKNPLLISLVFDEQALRDDDAVDEFLNVLTTLKSKGFYMIMNPRHSGYPAPCDENALANLMYMVYVLSRVNQYEVVCGYSDLVGIPLHAAGADATATGWASNLRQFSIGRFQPNSGRQRRPKPRYTSQPLISSIRVEAELTAIADRKRLKTVLSGTDYDVVLDPSPADGIWQSRASYLHHWQVLNRLISKVSAEKDVSKRLAVAISLIQDAIKLYAEFEGRNPIRFKEVSSRTNLGAWLNAMNQFKKKAKL